MEPKTFGNGGLAGNFHRFFSSYFVTTFSKGGKGGKGGLARNFHRFFGSYFVTTFSKGGKGGLECVLHKLFLAPPFLKVDKVDKVDWNDAFNFSSTMPKEGINPQFSLECVFCNSKNTANLMADGSFKRCLNRLCRRDFQAKIISPFQIQQQPEIKKDYQRPRHPNDYIMFQQRDLMQQQLQNQEQPLPTTAQLHQQFSQPNYDTQIRK